MKRVLNSVRQYLSRPENGAGLFYVALALGILRNWMLYLHEAAGRETVGAALAGMVAGPQGLFHAWTVVSFALSAWLAFMLLRRRLSHRALQRLLMVAAVHALGAIRFYDWGLLLLSILPLFAIAPALLLPQPPPRR